MIGHFENPEGYELTKTGNRKYYALFSKSEYICIMDPDEPLTYVTEEGVKMRTRPRIPTDMGTTPYLTRLLYPKDQYLLSYLLHDEICEYGGLFVKLPDEYEYVFTEIDRFNGNKLLREMVKAEGCGPIRAWVIKFGTDGAAWVNRFKTRKTRASE
ncbi:hypothetical protein N9937_01600 [bacterium]|nr:hypothetical protein [bacterium]